MSRVIGAGYPTISHMKGCNPITLDLYANKFLGTRIAQESIKRATKKGKAATKSTLTWHLDCPVLMTQKHKTYNRTS